MGIPFYYSDLIKKYPDIIQNPKNVNILFFDYNGLIHPIAHDTICKGNKTEDDFFHILWKKTLDLVEKIKPDKYIISIDGVAPLAKINQQRKRRYTSIPNKIWDTNAITCGTPFMNRLNKYIKARSIHLDSMYNNGEGEHKILDIIHNDENENNIYLIHGLDADLILLSLMSEKSNNIYLLREQNNNITTISIKKIKEYIELEWCYIFNNNADIIKSYCVLLSIMGNDFIPHPISLTISNNGINILKTVSKGTCLISKENPNEINKLDLQLIFRNLIYYEDKFMANEPKDWRKKYYRNEVYIEDIPTSCKYYIDGIFWTYNYYNKNINKIDHNWYYPYLGCPTIADIVNYLTTYEYKPNYNNEFIQSKEQLLIVMPKTSINVLPKDLHKYMLDPTFGLEYLFVADFKLIKYLKKHEWEYVPYLPLIDIQYIKSIFDEITIY
tara:strand:- start:196 stop:1518 length:1323 start_codon:yes stop_codon:yes gene_type:complete